MKPGRKVTRALHAERGPQRVSVNVLCDPTPICGRLPAAGVWNGNWRGADMEAIDSLGDCLRAEHKSGGWCNPCVLRMPSLPSEARHSFTRQPFTKSFFRMPGITVGTWSTSVTKSSKGHCPSELTFV